MHEDNFGRFLAEARKFPILEAGEERDLVHRWRNRADQVALTQLLGCHLRLVVKLAFGYRGYGLPFADLVGEGNVGLMQAAERFDTGRGCRFATYAQWWIRAAIHDYILRNWSLVRLGTTSAQKKLFFNLRSLKGSLGAYEEGDLSPEVVSSIAAALGVREVDVVEMNRRLAGKERSLNTSIGESESTSHQDLLVDESADQEAAYAEAEELRRRRMLLKDGFEVLTPRERRILTERKLAEKPKTLGELGDAYGVSRERVRQIELAALNKLKKAVRAKATQHSLRKATGKRADGFLVAA